MARSGGERSYRESCALLDRIVGRCIRDARFADWVLAAPEDALAEYQLTEDEFDDFRALSAGHLAEADEVWRSIRARMTTLQARSNKESEAIVLPEES